MKLLLILFVYLLMGGLAHAVERGPAVQDVAAAQIAKNVYVIHGPKGMPNPQNKGFMNNPGFVVTKSGVVVVDPGGSVQSGEMVLRQIRKFSKAPVVAVFNTHVHGDHWLGNQAVKTAFPDVKIYGHPKMREEVENGAGEQWVDMMERMTEGKTIGTGIVPPNQSADNGDELVIGAYTFRSHHYGTAHTTGDIMIEVVEPGVVFLGDNVTKDRMPRMDDGSFQGNIKAIRKILSTGAKVYVPGHGPTGDHSVPESCLAYLQILYDTVQKLYEDGLSDFEMKQQVLDAVKNYSGWDGFEAAVGKHISLAYLEIEAADF